MFTEETIGRDDVRGPALSTLDADFAVHATAIEELYRRMLGEIAEAARAWTPEIARLEGQQSPASIPTQRRATRAESRSEGRIELPTQAITAPRAEPRTESDERRAERGRQVHHGLSHERLEPRLVDRCRRHWKSS